MDVKLNQELRDAKRGTILYSPIFGDLVFNDIRVGDLDSPAEKQHYIINVSHAGHSVSSMDFYNNGELASEGLSPQCMLFPHKYVRDWKNLRLNFLNEEDLIGKDVICVGLSRQDKELKYLGKIQTYLGGGLTGDPDTNITAYWQQIYPEIENQRDGILLSRDAFNLHSLYFREKRGQFPSKLCADNFNNIEKILLAGETIDLSPYTTNEDENINILSILEKTQTKRGERFYSPAYGEVFYYGKREYWGGKDIIVGMTDTFFDLEAFNNYGQVSVYGECMLYPLNHYDWRRYEKEHKITNP